MDQEETPKSGWRNPITWFAIIFIAIIVLTVIIVTVLLLSSNSSVVIHGSCDNKNTCRAGLTCDSGVCKANIGTACATSDDCVSSSMGCISGICMAVSSAPASAPASLAVVDTPAGSGPSNSALTAVSMNPFASGSDFNHYECDVPIGSSHAGYHTHQNIIHSRSRKRGMTSARGLGSEDKNKEGDRVIVSGSEVYHFGSKSIKDIAEFQGKTIILLEDGNITLDTGAGLITVKPNISLDRVFQLGDILYGLKSGKMYYMLSRYPNPGVWKWDPVEWAPDGIIFASVSLNKRWIWIQVLNGEEGSTGYLYRLTSSNETNGANEIELVGNKELGPGVDRIYGIDNRVYLEIDRYGRRAMFNSEMGQRIVTDIVDGALNSTGGLKKVSPSGSHKFKAIRVINDKFYVIVEG